MHAPLVVGLGRIGVAISGLGPNLPGVDAHVADLAAFSTSPAPGVAAALRAALRLGCRARVTGSHGADLLGQLARTAIREAGIDVEMLRAVGTSACDVVLVAGDGTLRTRYSGDRGEPVASERRGHARRRVGAPDRRHRAGRSAPGRRARPAHQAAGDLRRRRAARGHDEPDRGLRHPDRLGARGLGDSRRAAS